MKNKITILLGLLAITCLSRVTASEVSTSTRTTSQPNVLIIFTDDLGYGDISSFASKPLKTRTPNIDKLASEGMKFTQFYVNMPICSPSRAALITGMFAPETGLTTYLQTRKGNREADQNDFLNPALAHLPKMFQNNGYATAHVGKWHLGGGRDVDNAPPISDYGYDESWSTWESPSPDPKLGSNVPSWNENKPSSQLERWETTAYMVDKTLSFARQHRDRPWFITLWPEDVHTPFIPSPDMVDKHGANAGKPRSRENFEAVLENYDNQIGRLMQQLRSAGLEESTIVIFTGDNGPNPDFDGVRTGGLRGAKGSLYEGGIREPFIIRWPGTIPRGSVNDKTVLSSIDLLPSLAAMTGIKLPEDLMNLLDGEDLSAAFNGNKPIRKSALLFEFGRNRKRGAQPDSRRSPTLAIRDGDFKLLVNHDGSGAELYNIATDRLEKSNIADANTTLTTRLKQRLVEWSRSLPHRTHP